MHRISLHDGKRLWYTPPPDAHDSRPSFSDGGITLAPDGRHAYTCSNQNGSIGSFDGSASGVARRRWRAAPSINL